ncbi:hypothetical protein [Nonomuraea dietziae]|uniref:hypothetical protein n=1 Tax=Nonomuraea dietziae TaxID=65515 RepID=UPI00343665F4
MPTSEIGSAQRGGAALLALRLAGPHPARRQRLRPMIAGRIRLAPSGRQAATGQEEHATPSPHPLNPPWKDHRDNDPSRHAR